MAAPTRTNNMPVEELKRPEQVGCLAKHRRVEQQSRNHPHGTTLTFLLAEESAPSSGAI
jgi:hypothetical protein